MTEIYRRLVLAALRKENRLSEEFHKVLLSWVQLVWEGGDDGGIVLASGVYLCRLESDGFVTSQRLTLMK